MYKSNKQRKFFHTKAGIRKVGKKVVEELIQHQVNEQRLVAELKLLFTTKVQQQLSEDYTLLRTKLGGTGASERAANVVVALAG